MRALLVITSISVSLLVAVAPALATEIRVGNATEIAQAAKTAKPGDVFILKNGTWRDAQISLKAIGTPEQPIVLRAETPGGVTLTGKSWVRISGQHLVVDGLRFEKCNSDRDVMEFRTSTKEFAHQSRLTHCEFVDCDPPDSGTNTRWISLYGTGNRVDHCRLRGKKNLGTTLVVWLTDVPVQHRVDHNHFSHRPRLKVNGGETIRIGDSTTATVAARVIVEDNLFEACNGEAEIISNKSHENIYRRNTFLECEGALTIRMSERCVVEGNFFLGNGKPYTGGVRVIDADHRIFNNYFENLGGEGTRAALCFMNGIPDSPPAGYYQVKRAIVAFNTFVNCRETIVGGFIHRDEGARPPSLAPVDCTFANNLIIGTNGPLVKQITPFEKTQWLGNLVYGAKSGLPDQTGLRSVDPQLKRGADGLWRPATDSPARGAATGDYPFVTTDMDGQPRGPRKDVGSDQAGDGPLLHHPLTAADVGPAWGRRGK